jgi:hypothetical protein
LTRYDLLHVSRDPSEDKISQPAEDDPPSFTNDDRVWLFSGAAYVQATTHWSNKFRSVLGFREDYQHGTDIDYEAVYHEAAGYSNTGTAQQQLPSPRAASSSGRRIRSSSTRAPVGGFTARIYVA